MSNVLTLHVFDDVSLGLIPRDAKMIGVYDDGLYADVTRAKAMFPHAMFLHITVHGLRGVKCADCENGDLTPAQAARWAAQEIHDGRRPMIYCSVSVIMSVVAELRAFGHGHQDVDWWSAHYNGFPHICNPHCGFGLMFEVGGTQYTDRSHGVSLDESLFYAVALGIHPIPAPRVDVYAIHPVAAVKWAGKTYHERAAVMAYDRLRRHPIINRKKLRSAREDMLALAECVLFLAHHKPNDLSSAGLLSVPRWGTDHLGDRERALLLRSQGQRPLK